MTPPRPNFLFLFPDQWRWDWIGAMATVPVRTPNLDALAQSGTLLEQVRTSCPICAPSRASLATAKRFHRAGVRNNASELDPARPNLFHALAREGYAVLTSGKSDLHTFSEHFHPSGWHPALGDLGFTGGLDFAGKWRGLSLMEKGVPDAYGAYLATAGGAEAYREDMLAREQQRRFSKDYKISTDPSPLPAEATSDAFCARASMDLLAKVPDGKPWFLWVNFPGPHEPFDPPAEFQKNYEDTPFPMPVEADLGRPENHQGIRRNYAGMIEHLDHQIGSLVQAVEERGERDNTFIIFASDHGELLGDHGLWYKQKPQEGSVHVPCILSGPGIRQVCRCGGLVELIDLNPTILDWAGRPPLPDSDGRSLRPLLEGSSAAHRAYTLTAHDRWRMVFDGTLKVCEERDGSVRLWNLATDPEERVDLSRDANYEAERDRLLALLARECPWFP